MVFDNKEEADDQSNPYHVEKETQFLQNLSLALQKEKSSEKKKKKTIKKSYSLSSNKISEVDKSPTTNEKLVKRGLKGNNYIDNDQVDNVEQSGKIVNHSKNENNIPEQGKRISLVTKVKKGFIEENDYQEKIVPVKNADGDEK